MRSHLWLIGMMGSGKSVVGALVADHLGAPFVDTDCVVEQRAGAPISQVWRDGGEAAFREQESAAIAQVATEPAAVVATGGGAVLDSDNIAAMRAVGSLVWLRATAQTLAGRIGDDTSRPLLAAERPLDRLRSIHAERYPAYKVAADVIIDTDNLDAGRVATRIEEWWNES